MKSYLFIILFQLILSFNSMGQEITIKEPTIVFLNNGYKWVRILCSKDDITFRNNKIILKSNIPFYYPYSSNRSYSEFKVYPQNCELDYNYWSKITYMNGYCYFSSKKVIKLNSVKLSYNEFLKKEGFLEFYKHKIFKKSKSVILVNGVCLDR
jgi:hypothetical protein